MCSDVRRYVTPSCRFPAAKPVAYALAEDKARGVVWQTTPGKLVRHEGVFSIDQTQKGTKGKLVGHLRKDVQMALDNYNTWQRFAEAASVEHDSEKLTYLIQQLNNALDEEDMKNSSDETCPDGIRFAF